MQSKDTPLCQVCGAPFHPRADHVRDGMGRFCSRRCAARSRTWDNEAIFWSKVDRSGGPGACWPFTGCITKAGYGQLGVKGEVVYGHRFAYELLVGPIPAGWQLHHECKNRSCCNPNHLTPMPRSEHVSMEVKSREVTHCPNGHLYDEANSGCNARGRYCRTCMRERSLRQYYRRKAALEP